MNRRVKILNNKKILDRPLVVYWMQASQRVEYNHALAYAIQIANELAKPLVVFFGITDNFPEANARHYCFMLQGLKEVKEDLENKKIKMLIRRVSPEKGALELSDMSSLVITDRGYLRIERDWRKYLADNANCKVVQIESNVVVPVEEVSDKEEYSAATIRKKILKKMEVLADKIVIGEVMTSSLNISLPYAEIDVSNISNCIKELAIDSAVGESSIYFGGYKAAKSQLKDFINNKLGDYSNIPDKDNSSGLSPYLHFGQISPLEILNEIENAKAQFTNAFLEELIVRRELSVNFVFYNKNYDNLSCIPAWARKTLEKHTNDMRNYSYSLQELEQATTHDEYWNAAQKEMVISGKMNGYMRMYWCKKIIEWNKNYEDAYKAAIYLNNKYSLDGRDPNSFAGIAWCFGKHDRPWTEREIFGNVRYMNSKGLDRKFDMKAYLSRLFALGK